MFKIVRPTEFADHLAYIMGCAPDEYPQEDFLSPEEQPTNSTAFGEAFEAMQRFIESARTEEEKEKLRECERNLRVTFELYEHGDIRRADQFLQESEEMFQRCRKYISISDE